MIRGYILAKSGGGYACDTSICKAACCRSCSFRPDKDGPCEYLTDDYRCELHVVGGIACKPVGCAEYPSSNADVTVMNRMLEASGIKERCHLTVDE